MTIKRKTTGLFFICFVLCFAAYYKTIYCSVDRGEINHIRGWLWEEGYSVGDVIVVTNADTSDLFYVDSNDSLCRRHTCVAKVLRLNNDKMTIASKNGEKGYYYLP